MKTVVFIALVVLVAALFFTVLINASIFVQNFLSILVIAVFLFIIWRFDFIVFLKDYERAVIFRFGKVKRVGGPGWAFLVPLIESYSLVDLRTQTIDIPTQDVITADGIEIRVDAVLYLSVDRAPQSVVNSVIEIRDYRKASILFVVSSMRDIVGGINMFDVIGKIEEINEKLKKGLEKISKDWGIHVEAVELKDVDIPETVLSAMHGQKAAVQEKLARFEGADAHKREILAVKEAARELDERALSYYYVRALEKMADGKATKIIFPVEVSRLAEAIGGKLHSGLEKKGFDLSKVQGYDEAIKAFLKAQAKKKKK